MTTVWTIYYRSPDPYVAYRSIAPREGEQLMVSSDLVELRMRMARLGLHCTTRNFFDAPDIVEIWHE